MKRIRVGLIMTFLTFVIMLMPGSVMAEPTGSIEITLPQEGIEVEMTLYPVADFVEGKYVCSGAFAECGIELPDFSDADAVRNTAEQLTAYIRSNNITGMSALADSQRKIYFNNLPLALYLAVQTNGESRIEVQKCLIPVPCTTADGVSTNYVSVAPKYEIPEGAAILNKINPEQNSIANVVFTLEKKTYISDTGEVPEGTETGQDVNGRYMWENLGDYTTDGNGQIVLENLAVGLYRFIEKTPAEGYVKPDTEQYFEVKKGGTVQLAEGKYQAADDNVVQLDIINQPTSLSVNKVDEKGKTVEGAVLVIKDSEGKIICDDAGQVKYQFTSSKEPYNISGIPAGNYFLSEVEAPAGYKVSQDVPFEVVIDSQDTILVTMVDEKETQTDASLSVIKELKTVGGENLQAIEADFYVALFEDEELTRRISSVQKIHFDHQSSSSVTFENIELNKQYYVAETDEFGQPLALEETEGGFFFPAYPEGQSIVVTPEQPDIEYCFHNEFYEVPDNYYYEGVLTITKKVLRGGQAFANDETYYAGIFTDPEYTQLYTDVVELKMENQDTTSTSIIVAISPDEGEEVVLYVTETDKEGNPLANSDELSFTFTVENSTVVLSQQETTSHVIITNEYEEEIIPSPTPTPGTTTTPGVRTGDDTNLALYIKILLAALAVTGLLLVLMRKRYNKSE